MNLFRIDLALDLATTVFNTTLQSMDKPRVATVKYTDRYHKKPVYLKAKLSICDKKSG